MYHVPVVHKSGTPTVEPTGDLGVGARAPTPRTRRVLVVEDDRITREYVAGLLRGHGMDVTTLESGSPAIDMARGGKVDLVLLDVIMPGVSGVDVCRMIKSVTGNTFIPVILLTAKSDTASRVEGLRIGADDYVCKPFDERELLARVESMLRIKHMHDEVAEAKVRLQELAVRDELTGLFNFRYLHTRLHEEFMRAERYREPLACAMIDVDHFKRFNDEFGHEIGDAVIKGVAERLRDALREIDVVARYGGDEFLVILPSTHFSGALTVADRCWRSVGERPFAIGGAELEVTVTVGVPLYPSRDVGSKDELLRAADAALYQAKEDGRDCICVFQHQGYIYQPRS